MKFLCRIGFHKWGRTIRVSHGFSSSVFDSKKSCERCGKVKRWVEIKK